MKETYYFSHDYNARNDEKIIKLIQKEGWEAYGIYWAVVEKIYELLRNRQIRNPNL
jgi:hypothetical protein